MSEVVVMPVAEAEVVQAFRWYATRSPAAARKFLHQLAVAYRLIGEHPNRFPWFKTRFRFIKLKSFDYIVVYRVRAAFVTVECVNHTSRSNRFWKRRLG